MRSSQVCWSLVATALLSAACGPSSMEDAGPGDGGSDAGAFEQWLAPLAAPLVNPAGASGKATGLVIAVSSPKLRGAFGFGATRVGGPAPTGTTLYELGSLTKVYTGVLLGLAVEDHSATLAETIDAAFPAGAPHYQGQAISLLDLATHTSGLPNYPGNVHPTPGNPGAGYSEQDLATFMSTYTLPVAPGTRSEYSNLGSGLLGYVLRKKAGVADYDTLVQQRIVAPLQLVDTTVHLTTEQRSRLAQGYDQGQPAPELDIGEPLSGGGALRATGEDVLRFLESALGVGRTPALTAAWTRVLQPQRPIAGSGNMIGLQVSVETVNGGTLYTKSGGTPGFSTWLMFSTSQQTAVVLLSNGKDVPASALKQVGQQVLDHVQAL